MKKVIIILMSCLLVGCSSKLIEPKMNSVYYEIFVGSFYDSNKDGIGDLKGVSKKLDYLKELGVTSIWLMPINESNTYHKYDVIDYYKIDKDYGSITDLKELIANSEEKNIDIILDLVINHTSIDHPWFVSAKNSMINNTCDTNKYCDYYNFSDEFKNDYHKIKDKLYYEGVFWDQMPDLNLSNQDVKNEIEKIVKYYLDLGVKGFRLDATTHYFNENKAKNIEFLKWFNEMVKTINPDAYLVGEAWTSEEIIKDMYESNIDSFFNFTMSQKGNIVSSINRESGYELAERVEKYNLEIKEKNSKALDALFLSNHDNDRSSGYLSSNINKQKLAASIYLLMSGNVFIYYGEEISLKGSGKDENKRLAMNWTNKDNDFEANNPLNSDYKIEQELAVDEALKDKDSLLNHYKKVLSIRNSHQEFQDGNPLAIDLANDKIMALDYGDFIVCHNLSKEKSEFKLVSSKIENITGDNVFKNELIIMDAYASIIVWK
ncbi:MAG: alpha-amylase family glycosyl hydrolase [Anaerorhabdus sp.]